MEGVIEEAQSNRMCYGNVILFLLQLARSKRLFFMCESIECLVTKTLHTREWKRQMH